MSHTCRNVQVTSPNCGRGVLASSCLSACQSVRMDQIGSYRKDFYKILYLRIFRKICPENSSFFNVARIMDTVREDVRTCLSNIQLSSSQMRNIVTQVVEKIKTHFVFSNLFPKILSVYEVTQKNIVEPGRTQMTI